MSEKLKTFVEHDGVIVINQGDKFFTAIKRDEKYNLSRLHDFNLTMEKKQIIKLFNLDLEVDDEA